MALAVRKDGEWFHVAQRGHVIECCDCGARHVIKPRLRGRRIEIAATRIPRGRARKRR